MFGYFHDTMRTPGRQTRTQRVWLGLMLVAAGALALGATGCGQDEHENLPREPVAIEITTSVSDRQVDVSPSEVGAGLATFTIANLSDESMSLTISGPTDDASNEIPPGGTGIMKMRLREGTYEVTAGQNARPRPDELSVGPERPSAQNELLLP
jgi:hypothetical protein